jgi:hypothetical protein
MQIFSKDGAGAMFYLALFTVVGGLLFIAAPLFVLYNDYTSIFYGYLYAPPSVIVSSHLSVIAPDSIWYYERGGGHRLMFIGGLVEYNFLLALLSIVWGIFLVKAPRLQPLRDWLGLHKTN